MGPPPLERWAIVYKRAQQLRAPMLQLDGNSVRYCLVLFAIKYYRKIITRLER
jgi:hypothetical protein